jgi:hypothetical protein
MSSDCKFNNIMGDLLPLYDSLPHPYALRKERDFSGDVLKVCSTRTRTPVKYYLVDFGLSREHAHNLPAPASSIELVVGRMSRFIVVTYWTSDPCHWETKAG